MNTNDALETPAPAREEVEADGCAVSGQLPTSAVAWEQMDGDDEQPAQEAARPAAGPLREAIGPGVHAGPDSPPQDR